MSKKKWALLVLVAILIFGYIKLFYKTYNENTVAQTADRIIVIDVKRITNTLIWQYITTPSQWKGGRLFPKKSDKVDWKDMFVLPDFIFAFHTKDQPVNAWYTLLTIKDKADFEKGLVQFQFEKINDRQYINKNYGIRFLINDNKVLVANAGISDTVYMASVANELFTKKAFIPRATLAKTIKAKSHLAVYIAANGFLQEEAVIAANFDKKRIEVTGTIAPKNQYNFTENDFQYSSGSLCTSGFTQPSAAVYDLLGKAQKEKISTALNINIDSLLQQSNKNYSLNITAIKQRADSAISYGFDDEFNKVEKVVVNNIQEPAFEFVVNGDSVSDIYTYLQRNGKLEKTAAGELFTPMPLVRSYCSIKNEKQLAITAFNYTKTTEDQSIKSIFFLNCLLTKIPADLQKYLPGDIIKAISNIEAVKLSATKKDDKVVLSAVLEKKKNDLPIIKF